MLKITLGCDPEIFVHNKDQKPRSAYGMIPGTKSEPHLVEEGMVQIDGTALEFGIDPCSSEDEWVRRINKVMSQMRAMLPKGYDFLHSSSVVFNGNHFRKQPKEALELGCEPDYDAYTLQANPRPVAPPNFRTAGGHVHIGFCEDEKDILGKAHMDRCATLVKQLDVYLGLPSVLFDRDTRRRRLYGGPGAFRPKSYGCEYRTLSNSWIEDEWKQRFVYRATTMAIEDLLNGVRGFDGSVAETDVKDMIKNSQHYRARNALRRFKPKLFGEVSKCL